MPSSFTLDVCASGALVATVATVIVLSPGGATRALAGPCDAPVTNPIACENTKPGSSDWELSGPMDRSILGFSTDISVNRGGTVSFKVKTDAMLYTLDIYRMGYYAGMGARKIASILPSAALPQTQPACLTNSATGLIDCGNWAVSASWSVPADATSGIYFAKLVRQDTLGASHVFFIVRDDDGRSDLLFQTADTTWQAYNNYGGNSLYVGAPAGRAYKVSYNRPFTTREVSEGARASWVFNAEYPMVRWLEANGYNVSYSTGVDSDRRGGEILEHKVFLSVGHDEYWSAAQRANVEAARAAGVHLAFFSGNEVFWKTRWENSIDGSNTPHRTLVCYKETHAGAKIDPLPNVWTGTWRDPRFSPPADGGRPENALTGTIFTVNGTRTDPIKVSEPHGKLRFWRDTSLADLTPGQEVSLPNGVLGYEWDEDLDNGFRPPGLFAMSSTTIVVPAKLLDHGSTYGSGAATHSLTLYRHESGALVFGSGTVQWSWGLDSHHDRGAAAPDVRMQQATVNLLADMGVQPETLELGLLAASPSLDTIAPVSIITFPDDGADVTAGVTVDITGSASDAGGGIVAGVEVSVDGGNSWRRASGRESWSYAWKPLATGPVTIQSRAVDDSANIETPGPGVDAEVQAAVLLCPCTIWTPSATPATASHADTSAVEVGVKFRSDLAGHITGIRFYKGSLNTGTHVANLWTRSGTQLASATFTTETASGWQQVDFATPVAIAANTTYVASYYAPVGRYARNLGYFTSSGEDNGMLHALANGVDGGNGVYRYGVGGGFPSLTSNASNYWVDVVFMKLDTTPPPISGVSATSIGQSTATIVWTTGEAADSQVEYGTTTAYGSSTPLDTTMVTSHSVALSGLSPGTLYHYRVRSRDAAGNLATSADFVVSTTAETTPPVISGVSAKAVAVTSATIVWITNEPADSQVEYGTTTAYGSSTLLQATKVTSHSVGLSGLSPRTLYHYRVRSKNAAGNLAISADFVFTTKGKK
jgi:Domain of unknown function (DUF4082)/Bacterial Ig domain/Purple acid Phosphatase, N-terminal domain